MSRVTSRNLACDNCNSSDAKQIYEDGSGFCFSCEHYFKASDTKELTERKPYNNMTAKPENFANRLKEIETVYPIKGFRERNIFKPVSEHYNVRVSHDLDGEIDAHFYPYYEEGVLVAYKQRILPKQFLSIGNLKGGLFGQQNYSGGKKLVITEGELDAMALQSAWYKKYKRFMPIVSIRSASCTDDLIAERAWIRNFDEVVLWFDNDAKGQEAVKKAARIIGYDKIRLATHSEKDASAAWLATPNEVVNCIYQTTRYTPAGILGKEELWKKLEEYNSIESVPYPPFMDGLNKKLKGMRKGEITLWTSGTGSGKSTLLREIALHLIDTTESRMGIISLEESPAETARKLAGAAIFKNPAENEIPLDELRVGYDKVFDTDRVMVLDHYGSINDGSIMDFLEHMCLSGCEYIFIDHITILVSEGSEGLTGNEAVDKVMNDLLKLVKKYDVWIGLISHLRKANSQSKSFEDGRIPSIDDIRGSGSIKQISMDIIGFARDLGAESDEERNIIQTKVLKCRYTGLTGPSGSFKYDFHTGRLEPSHEDFQPITL